MMRTLLVSTFLLPVWAYAQAGTSNPPKEPPVPSAASSLDVEPVAPAPSAPTVTPVSPADTRESTRGVSLQDPRETKRGRPSRFSAGPGGPLFAFTEVLAGITTGAIVGAAMDSELGGSGSDAAYLGALTGGLVLGGTAAAYQSLVPIGMGKSSMLALGAGVGFLAGLGTVDLLDDELDSISTAAWLVLGATQVGVLTTLLATLGLDDISGQDAALVGMSTTYAAALTGLVMAIADARGQDVSMAPILLAPAGGMALGALLATQLDLAPGRVLKLTALPLGVGLTLLYLGHLADDPVIPPATALVGTVVTFGLTALFTAEPPSDEGALARKDEQGLDIQITPLLTPSGRRGEAMAAGAGAFLRW